MLKQLNTKGGEKVINSLKDIEQGNLDIMFELKKTFDFVKEQQEEIDDLKRKVAYWKTVAEGKKINP